MTDLILLAAGASRRFGKQKLLEDFQGRPLYRYAFDAAAETDARVLVVTRRAILEKMALPRGFEAVLVPDNCGVGVSVAAGAKAARADANLCFFVCDAPYVTGKMLREFLAGFESSGKKLGRLRAGENFGSPTIFSADFRPALAALSGDEGGRALFSGRENDTHYYEVPAEVLRDFDTPWAEKGKV